MRSLPPPSGLRGGGGNRASDVTAQLRPRRINTQATAAPGADTSRDPGRCALPASLSPRPRHAVSSPGPTRRDPTGRPDPATPRDPPTPRRVSDAPGPTAAQGTVCPRPPQLAASPFPAFPLQSALKPVDAPGAAAPLPLVPCLLPGHRLPGASQTTRCSSPSVAGTPPTRAGPRSDLRPRCAAPPPPLPLQMRRGGALLLASLLLAGTLSATPGLGSPVSAEHGQTPPEPCPLSAKGGDRIRTGLGGGWALRARNGNKRRGGGAGRPGSCEPG